MRENVKDSRKPGVARLKDRTIEEMAYEFLSRFNKSILRQPQRTPITEILGYLKNSFKVRIVFTELGNKGDNKVVGRTIFSKNTICIDSNLVQNVDLEPLFRSIAAHEIAHWILHRGRKIKIDQAKDDLDQVDDTEQNLLGKKRLRTSVDWMEHQAKVFAASLLMPRNTFAQEVINKQKEMGISRNRGKIIVNIQNSSRTDFYLIVSHLQNVFGVSRQSVEIWTDPLQLDSLREQVRMPDGKGKGSHHGREKKVYSNFQAAGSRGTPQ